MPMRLRYLSDIHLEFLKPNKIPLIYKKILPINQEDVFILAGDIGNPFSTQYDEFMQFMSNHCRKIFVIAGNHEYYQKKHTIVETQEMLKRCFEKYPNISFLNNSYENFEGFCFIGSTLWSHITKPEYEINDVYSIPKFDYIKYNKLHRNCIEFLKETVPKTDRCIVITHHLPSNTLVDKKYKKPSMLPYNQWFSSDMDDFIRENKSNIACWIYGHTHTPSKTDICGVPMLCNPIGYPNENSRHYFDETFVLPSVATI